MNAVMFLLQIIIRQIYLLVAYQLLKSFVCRMNSKKQLVCSFRKTNKWGKSGHANYKECLMRLSSFFGRVLKLELERKYRRIKDAFTYHNCYKCFIHIHLDAKSNLVITKYLGPAEFVRYRWVFGITEIIITVRILLLMFYQHSLRFGCKVKLVYNELFGTHRICSLSLGVCYNRVRYNRTNIAINVLSTFITLWRHSKKSL